MEDEVLTAHDDVTPRHYEALALVNEKVVMSGSQLAHLMYKNQSATQRASELLCGLVFVGLLEQYQAFPPMFTCTEKGEKYLADVPRPVKPFTL